MKRVHLKKSNSRLSLETVVELIIKCIFDPNFPLPAMVFSLIFETFACIFIIKNVEYTEIDWNAYMQEVEGFLNGTRNYTLLKGDTGPLVYPAGFVYIFSLLYKITDKGRNLQLAQCIFMAIFLIMTSVVFAIYKKSKSIPPYVIILMSVSAYRIHSIFLLRLFNDCIAMMYLYIALYLLLNSKWLLASITFSLALSVKMNVLLFAPAFFFVLLYTNGLVKTALMLLIGGSIQIIFGLPFLLTDPVSYLRRSFDFGRQFFYQWTVNWRFIPEWIFLSRQFHIVLLVLHMAALLFFAAFIWSRFKHFDSWKKYLNQGHRLSVNSIILMMFQSNLIGITFSRSLHYQFYVWYYHTLPFLIFTLKIRTSLKLLIFGLIEMSWNTYPSTVFSSLTLFLCHLTILFANATLSRWTVPKHVHKN